MDTSIGNSLEIDRSCSFKFNNKMYMFVAVLGVVFDNNDIKDSDKQLVFDDKYIELFEYTNELNSFCITGNLIYHDTTGSLLKFLTVPGLHLTVTCFKTGNSIDGAIGLVKPKDKIEKFIHRFIVQSIDVIKREENIITYQLSLISEYWYSIVSNVVFSNCDGNTESNSYLIMEKLIRDSFKKRQYQKNPNIDSDSFKNCANSYKLPLFPYVTSSNDNLITALRHIFQKLYYSKTQCDSTLKCIGYNALTNELKCIDYNNSNTWFTTYTSNLISIPLFTSELEDFILNKNIEITNYCKISQTEQYGLLFEQNIWNYNNYLGIFELHSESFSKEDISNFYNNASRNFSKKNPNGRGKLNNLLGRTDIFTNVGDYCNEIVQWNRPNVSFYDSLFSQVTGRNNIIYNVEGDLKIQPGMAIGSRIAEGFVEGSSSPSSNKGDFGKMESDVSASSSKKSPKCTDGTFFAVKVQHKFHLGSTVKEYDFANYTTNIMLVKDFY